VFFVADTRLTAEMVPEEVNVYLWRQGFHLFFPLRGTDHWRIVGIVPAELREKKDLSFNEVVPSMQREAGAGLTIQKCTWFSTYRIHHRRAERFRKGRSFLLGDAAHIHSPVGAQGMNTGLQDAYNLAWKLALVVSGRADESLLDSYEEERIPVAKRLLSTTDRAFSLIVSDNPVVGLVRTRVLVKLVAFAMGFASIQKLAFRTISQTGIHYRDSHLSETQPGIPGEAPRAGDRFPWLKLRFSAGGAIEDLYQELDDTRFNLLAFGQPAIADGLPALDDLLRIHEIPDDPDNDRELARAHIARPSFYLLRPDGHVGLAGDRLDAAEASRYVSQRLRFRNNNS
jgi:hypothetical protein